ncbi:gamma-glutamyltransferase [Rhodobacteraceae bacterium WD3A24]|nr:gamma-glutamyltransferase [Rhodobacteraceae bacterium WD3A24]
MSASTTTWNITKPEKRGHGGVIAAQNVTAAQAGADVLAEGGNAMDAAVTTAFALSVLEPWLSGVGGGGFLLHKAAATGDIEALDFSLVAPAALDPARYPLAAGDDGDWFAWPAVRDDRNLIGFESICVPGAVAGLAEGLRRYGSISLERALSPAIAHAQEGLAVDWFTSLALAIDAEGLARFPASAALFLEDGRAPRANSAPGAELPRIQMPRKAAMLRRLAEHGAQEFYQGRTAEQLVADLREGGSAISMDDMAAYAPVWTAPARGAYRGHDIHASPGLSGGPSLLHAMDELSGTLRPGAAPDAESALAYARAIRNAYAYRLENMGHAAPAADPGCTSHLSVVDAAGNVVSLTNTLLSRFGSKVVAPSAGILMNNGVMWFDPRPGKPNSIVPGARPLTNMCPLIVEMAGGGTLALGAAGGRQIFPALVQIASYILDYDMTLEEALHTPRIDASMPAIVVNQTAPPGWAARISDTFRVRMDEDSLYPVNFAVPSLAARTGGGETVGAAHPVSPTAGAVIAEEGCPK